MTTSRGASAKPATTLPIRDASLFVEVIGHGYPLLLMHGGPGADHWSMLPFRRCADQFTLVFYDHRCNGRSTGRPSLVDDLGEPDGRRRCAAREAGLRAVGRARPFVRRHGRPRVRPALPRTACRTCCCSTPAATVAGSSRTRRRSSPSGAIVRRRWSWPGASSTARSRPWEMVPALMFRFGTAYYHRPFSPRVARELFRERRAKPRRKALALRRRPAVEGLVGHGSPRRDHGADAGDGGTRRLPVPARVPGRAGGWDPGRAPRDHRARGPQPAGGAAGRSHSGGQRLHSPGEDCAKTTPASAASAAPSERSGREVASPSLNEESPTRRSL